jgi:hypothetical protein
MRTNRRSEYALHGGLDYAPRSAVRRLYCTECGALKDARKVGKSADYTLDCGHSRSLYTSEQVAERNARDEHQQ